jgi:hypothetical protein
MVALEAQMHIAVKIPSLVHEPASLIASRRGNFNAGLFKFGKRKQASHVPDEG